MQSGRLSGGQDEFWQGRKHPEVLHHLWPAGGLRALRRQHEPRHHHVAGQEAGPVHPCPAQPRARRGEPSPLQVVAQTMIHGHFVLFLLYMPESPQNALMRKNIYVAAYLFQYAPLAPSGPLAHDRIPVGRGSGASQRGPAMCKRLQSVGLMLTATDTYWF